MEIRNIPKCDTFVIVLVLDGHSVVDFRHLITSVFYQHIVRRLAGLDIYPSKNLDNFVLFCKASSKLDGASLVFMYCCHSHCICSSFELLIWLHISSFLRCVRGEPQKYVQELY